MQDATPMMPDAIIPADYQDVVDRIARVAAGLSRRIAADGLGETLSEARGTNADGDGQKALDLIADAAFRTALTGSAVRFYASEEQEEALEINAAGTLALAIDPLDGSSNIGVNVSIGTIFALFPAGETAQASFLRPGRGMVGAGYVIYGPQCALVVSLGQGVQKYLLDPETRRFRLVDPALRLVPKSWEFAINASNYRHWPRPIRAYVDDCVAGTEGPRTRGGVFLYPSDGRKGYEKGRLRLLYECAPIAFLIEQAGGAATDGCDAILDRAPAAWHDRSPFVFGCAANVARVAAYHDLPDAETAALFGSRGLFRS